MTLRHFKKHEHEKPDSQPERRRIRYAPVTFSEEYGVRYLHFGTEWVQGAMRLRKPDWIELEYAQQMMAWMLFLEVSNEAPRHIGQLGLGAASLTKFCYRHWTDARVTAVELNPDVIAAARSMFKLPPNDERLNVLQEDAWTYVTDPDQRQSHDVLQVDLYDATARGPVLDSIEFYSACRACLKAPGIMTVNLFGDHPSFKRNMKNIGAAFEGRVIALPEVHLGNRIALAFNGPPLEVDWTDLYEQAERIKSQSGLPAPSWVHDLRASRNIQDVKAKTGISGSHFRI